MQNAGRSNCISSCLVLFLACLVAGCGSGAPDESEPDLGQANPGDNILFDPAIELSDIPAEEIVEIPGSDLRVAYTTSALLDAVTADYVSAQWVHMKSCLGVLVPSPLVVVMEGWLPSDNSDDVLLSFDGRLLATTTFRDNVSDVLKISTFDFDGSQGNAGFHLRSIMGRYIWTVSNRPIRDYDTGCASSN